MADVGQQEVQGTKTEFPEMLINSQTVRTGLDRAQDLRLQAGRAQMSDPAQDGGVGSASRVVDTPAVVDRRRPIKADAHSDTKARNGLSPGAIQTCAIGLHRAPAQAGPQCCL